MAITGAIAAVGTVASGVMTSMAAGRAGKAAEGAFNDALGFQKGVYNTAQTNLTPWITGGQEALGGLEGFMGLPSSGGATGPAGGTPGSGALESYNQYTKTPFYTFPLAQTTATMDRAAAAKGMSLSTGQVADLGKMAGNYSAGNFGNYISALERLSGVGMNASSNLGQIGGTVGSEVGATDSGIANARANSIMAQNAGLTQAIQGVGGLVGGVATGNFPGFTNTGYSGNQNSMGSGALGGFTGGTGVFAGGSGGYAGPSNAANPSFDPRGIFAASSPVAPMGSTGSYYQTGT